MELTRGRFDDETEVERRVLSFLQRVRGEEISVYEYGDHDTAALELRAREGRRLIVATPAREGVRR